MMAPQRRRGRITVFRASELEVSPVERAACEECGPWDRHSGEATFNEWLQAGREALARKGKANDEGK
jgi:hypothetical protein